MNYFYKMNEQEIDFVKKLETIPGQFPDYKNYSNLEVFMQHYMHAFQQSKLYFRNWKKFEGCPDHRDYEDENIEEFTKLWMENVSNLINNISKVKQMDLCEIEGKIPEVYMYDDLNEYFSDHIRIQEESPDHPKNFEKFDGSPIFEDYNHNLTRFIKDYEKAQSKFIKKQNKLKIEEIVRNLPKFEGQPNYKDFDGDFEAFMKVHEKAYEEFKNLPQNWEKYYGCPNFHDYDKVEDFITAYEEGKVKLEKEFAPIFWSNFDGSPDFSDYQDVDLFVKDYHEAYFKKFGHPDSWKKFKGKPKFSDYNNIVFYKKIYSEAYENSTEHPKNYPPFEGSPKYEDFSLEKDFIKAYEKSLVKADFLKNYQNLPQRENFSTEKSFRKSLSKIIRRKLLRKNTKKDSSKELEESFEVEQKIPSKTDNSMAIICLDSYSNSIYKLGDSIIKPDFESYMCNSSNDANSNKINYEYCLDGSLNIKGTIGEGIIFNPEISIKDEKYVYEGGFEEMFSNLHYKNGTHINNIRFFNILIKNFDFPSEIPCHTLSFNRAVIFDNIPNYFYNYTCYEFIHTNANFILTFLKNLLKNKKPEYDGYIRLYEIPISNSLINFIDSHIDQLHHIKMSVAFNKCLFDNYKVENGKIFTLPPGKFVPITKVYVNGELVDKRTEIKFQTLYTDCIFQI